MFFLCFGVFVFVLFLFIVILFGGCENIYQYLFVQGYLFVYVDGFDDGCGSGCQVVGLISGEFCKDVFCYLCEVIYVSGWGDGFE